MSTFNGAESPFNGGRRVSHQTSILMAMDDISLDEVSQLRCEVDDMLSTTGIFSNEGPQNLNEDRFYAFWRRLEHLDVATFYVEALLRRLSESLAAEASKKQLAPLTGGVKMNPLLLVGSQAHAAKNTHFSSNPDDNHADAAQGHRNAPGGTTTDSGAKSKRTSIRLLQAGVHQMKTSGMLADTRQRVLGPHMHMVHAMVSTLYILALYYPVDRHDASLQAAVNAVRTSLTARPGVIPHQDSEWVAHVLGMYEPDGVASQVVSSSEPALRTLVSHTGQMKSMIVRTLFMAASMASDHTYQRSGGLNAIAGFIWLQECLHITGGAPFLATYSVITEIMTWPHSPQQEAAIICGLQMLRRFMSSYVPPAQMLECCVSALAPLYKWRNPIGHATKLTLVELTAELRVPGTLIQRRISEEMDGLSLRGSAQPESSPPSSTEPSDTSLQGRVPGSRIHVILNPLAHKGAVLRDRVNWWTGAGSPEEEAPSEGEVRASRLLVLASMMAEAGLLERAAQLDRFASEEVAAEEVQRLYHRALVATARAAQMESVEAAVRHRTQRLRDIAADVAAAAYASGLRSHHAQDPKRLWKLVREHVFCSSYHKQALSAIMHGIRNLSHISYLPYSTPPAPLQMELVTPSLDYRPAFVEVMGGTPGITAGYAATAAGDAIVKVLRKHRAAMGEGPGRHTHRHVRIGVAGGDGTLHHVLVGWVHICAYQRQILRGLDVSFYPLPCGKVNTLGAYLAKKDAFFGGMVMAPLQADLALLPTQHTDPTTSASDVAKTRGHGQGLQQKSIHRSQSFGSRSGRGRPDPSSLVVPYQMVQHQLCSWFRDANICKNIQVFVCEAWSFQGKRQYMHKLPFLCRAELGLACHLANKHKFQEKLQHLQQHMTTQGAHGPGVARAASSYMPADLSHSVAKYKLELAMSLTEVDLCGREEQEQTLVASRTFTSVVVNNLPHPSTPPDIPTCDPTDRMLDVHVADTEWTRLRTKRIRSLTDFDSAPYYRASNIQIDAPDISNPFDVLLDGELYGPFTKIRISPCRILGNQHDQFAKFPIMTTLMD